MSAFDSISRGLKEALDHAEGHKTSAKVHDVSVPLVDVSTIRKRTGLSQRDFARNIGVAKSTLINWEQGRRQPTGPAQVLLALIDREPTIVQDLLSDAAH